MTLTFLAWYRHFNKNNGGVKLVWWIQTSLLKEMMRSWKYFPYASEMPTPTYNWVSSVVLVKVPRDQIQSFTQREPCRWEGLSGDNTRKTLRTNLVIMLCTLCCSFCTRYLCHWKRSDFNSLFHTLHHFPHIFGNFCL
jgi:hypothetical protein